VMSGGAVSEGALSSSDIADAAQTEALSKNELVAMAAASETALAPDILPSTYCLNEEDFVASLLSGDKTGVASSAGSLDGLLLWMLWLITINYSPLPLRCTPTPDLTPLSPPPLGFLLR
jgi:hypothetical protein